MSKSADAFRTISEVADWMDTPAHVLRFWESKFTQVKPVKRAGGRRYYRPADMRLLGGIKKLLHEDGMTIKGAQKILREKGIKHVSSLCTLSLGDEEDFDDIGMEDVPMADPVDTVVPFSKPAEPVAEPEDAQPVMDLSAEPEPAVPDVDPAPPIAAPSEPEPEIPAMHDTASEDAPADTLIAQEDGGAEPQDAVAGHVAPTEESAVEIAQEKEPDIPALPAFLQHSMEERAEVAEEAAPEEPVAEVQPEQPEPVAPAQIESRDPTPGVLSMVARITSLSPELAREIAPLVEKLREKVA